MIFLRKIVYSHKLIEGMNNMKKNKVRIPYLEINERFYVENDELKMVKSTESRQGSWDDLWNGVLEIIYKVKEYDEANNPDN